jgi:hypothetical protein
LYSVDIKKQDSFLWRCPRPEDPAKETERLRC